jgi:hypothetical protein
MITAPIAQESRPIGSRSGDATGPANQKPVALASSENTRSRYGPAVIRMCRVSSAPVIGA